LKQRLATQPAPLDSFVQTMVLARQNDVKRDAVRSSK
jgi:hypothetical protein